MLDVGQVYKWLGSVPNMAGITGTCTKVPKLLFVHSSPQLIALCTAVTCSGPHTSCIFGKRYISPETVVIFAGINFIVHYAQL